MRTYAMSVPVEQHDNFIANGWNFVGMDRENAGCSLVSRIVEVPGDTEDVSVNISEPTKPALLQRAVVRRPLGKHTDARFFDSVSLDHMGSSAFEHNALPESLRRMHLTSFAYETFKAENLFLTVGGRSYALRLHTRLRGHELEQYVNWLIQLRSGMLKTKQPSGFTKQAFPDDELPKSPDLWWDIKNDVIFSFDKNYMKRLPKHLAVSFSIMDGTYSAGTIRRAS